MQTSYSHSFLDAVKEAAWNGDQVRAIDRSSKALAEPDLDSGISLDLYDTRAESYIALGKLDLAVQDAEAMIRIAHATEKGSHLSLALTRQAWVQMRLGDFDSAVSNSKSAVDAARSIEDMRLEARGLLCLAEAYMRSHQDELAVQNGQLAAGLFRRLDDLSGVGRALYIIGFSPVSRTNDLGKVREMAETALQYCRQTGDLLGTGDAFNLLVATEADIAKNIELLTRAQEVYKVSGYLERQILCYSNLSKRYTKLGLFRHARRLSLQGQALSRQIGQPISLGLDLADVSQYEIMLGNVDAARDCLDEIMRIASKVDYAYFPQLIESLKGDIALLERDFPEAVVRYKKLVNMAYNMANAHGEIGALDDLGRAYLAMREPAEALVATTQATEIHRSIGLDVIDELPPQRIWWSHSQALAANEHFEAAHEALAIAYKFLVDRIASMSDEGLRRNYLNKVEANCELLDAWLKDSAEKNLDPEERFKYLESEADLSEPFHRLVDTGLRLNQLHDAEELYEFLIQEATELSGAERVLLILEKENSHFVASSQMPKGEDAQRQVHQLDDWLEQARQGRSVQLETAESPDSPTPSRIIAPLIAQNRLLGYLYADMDARYGSLEQADADILGMLASQAAVALENVRLVEGLEEQVTERTAELQEANERAEEARQVAEEANRAKSTFLANMSHELRTPLNAIIGFTRIVRRKARGNLPEKQIDNLGKVQSSAEHLLGLINTILDIAKIEAGGVDVDAREFDVSQLIEICLATAQPLAKPGVEMRAEIDPELPLVYSDQDKIKQILLNLLSNAAKFTHHGEIVVTTEQTRNSPLATRNNILILEVADSGIGMNEEQLGRVFEEFQQADATTTRKYGGTGLGLPISKQLAQLLGGDLTASSIEGKGSAFTLLLPLHYENQESAP